MNNNPRENNPYNNNLFYPNYHHYNPLVAASVSVSPDQEEAAPSPGDPGDWEVVAYDGLAGKSRAREASLTAVCLVCGGKAAAHQHYGAVCCYSCR